MTEIREVSLQEMLLAREQRVARQAEVQKILDDFLRFF